MYLPAHFEETRTEVLHRLVERHPFGMLVTPGGADGPVANGIPFILDPGGANGLGTLRAHVARANPVWRETPAGATALAVFQGEQGYVSPGWYPSKREHGKVVPTWNYVIVQARGPLRVVDDVEWLRRFVGRLTDRHESTLARPWGIGDAPPDYLATMLRAIVGIEIELTALSGKWKLSQNRSAADRAGVVDGLAALGGAAAEALARRIGDPADPA
jgi:transcriptional regulator